jgi:murein DD-endopeptidase MepM/ murein hydrolase activator NlpD
MSFFKKNLSKTTESNYLEAKAYKSEYLRQSFLSPQLADVETIQITPFYPKKPLLVVIIFMMIVIAAALSLFLLRLKPTVTLPQVPSIDLDTINHTHTQLESGQSLLGLLSAYTNDAQDALNLISALAPLFPIDHLNTGQALDISYHESDEQKILDSLNIELGNHYYTAYRNQNGQFIAHATKIFLSSEQKDISGRIQSSLYNDGVKAGATPARIMELFDIFSYEIDYQRDLYEGDSFRLIFDAIKDEKNVIFTTNNIIAAEIKTHKKTYQAYMYKDKQGRVQYYDANGQGIKKGLLLMPLKAGRLTSTFGIRRNPLSGYTERHPALDFAAPMGTPIMAGGNGIVSKRGWDPRGYGNYIMVDHQNGYVTLYAHMSGYAKTSISGHKVNKGDTIGYVGSTGQSTGPHVHYEIRYKGKQLNPSIVVRGMGSSYDLKGEELKEFLQQIAPYKEKLSL